MQSRDDDTTLLAGKLLDRLMVHLMDWTRIDLAIHYNASMGIRYADQDDGIWKFEPGLAHLWTPSTEIHDAWELVEKLSQLGFNTRIEVMNDVQASIWPKWMNEFSKDVPIIARADTAPLAICRAVWSYLRDHEQEQPHA